MKARLALALALVLSALAVRLPAVPGTQECTTLVAAAGGTAAGGALLWKNRDTDTLSNKVVLVEDQPYAFLALVNADDPAGRMAWAGLNAAGFAVANSVAYNLPQLAGEEQDLEGLIMADALRTCRTVDDFERAIARRLGPGLGSRANFLVIDADGRAAIFETHNHGFKRLDADGLPGRRIANTNFSRSGSEHAGAGYLRFEREAALLEGIAPGQLDVTAVFQVLARDLGHALLRHPARADWKLLPAGAPYWIHTNYTIDRQSTAAAVVVQGAAPGQDPARATMWVALGEPVTSVAVPLWVAAGPPPDALWKGTDAPIALEAFRLKDLLRPLASRERREYADLTRLDNADGTGWLPRTLAVEREIIAGAEALLAGNPSAADLAAYQRAAAERALGVLRQTAEGGARARSSEK
jgi:hypothetical protein